MKVEWLNDELTEAQLTKGWFRKLTARAIRGSKWNKDTKKYDATDYRWYYPDGTHIKDGKWWCSMEKRRDAELQRRMLRGNWIPVAKLPKAVVL